MIKHLHLSLIFVAMLLNLNSSSWAQTPASSAWCATNAYHQNRYDTDSNYQQQFINQQQLIYNKVVEMAHQSNTERSLHVLPMVVHIVSPPGTPVGTGNNLTDAQVLAGLALLNQSFSNTGSFQTPSGVDTEIQFCLAQRDPAGQPTNGITRHSSPIVAQADCGGNAFNYGDENQLFDIVNWDCCQYINVYLVTDITGAGYGCSVAGYATVGSACGFMIQESQYWNTISGTQVTAHEMGHFFGLWHTFQGGCANTGNCLADGDAVCDTPPDNETFNPCVANTCNTDTPDLPDDTQNYMDYGACQPWHFTQGQKDRMLATLETVQSCLLNSMGCLSPCPAPLTASVAASATNVVVGTTVNFTGAATNASGYSYYINPSSPFANTLNSSYTFNSIGSFWVKFRAISNNSLCVDALDSLQITVSCNANALFNASSTSINEGTTVNFTNNSTGGTTNAWTLNNVPISNAVNYSYTFSTAGNYYVCLTVSNNICSDIYCQTIGVAPDGVPTGCAGNTFQKSYGGNAEDIAVSVKATTDGGYVIAGYTKSYGAGDNDGLLFKTAADGSVIWTKKIGIGGYNEQLNGVKQTTDGGYIAVGWLYPGTLAPCTGNPQQTGIIWRLDANGNTLWLTKVNGNTNNGEVIYNVVETTDGGFAFVGATNYGCSVVDAMVGKVAANGTMLWCKQWANDNGSTDVHVNLTTDLTGNIIVAGYTRSYHGDPLYDNYHNTTISKINGVDGSLLWSNEYYGQSNVAGGNEFSGSVKTLPNGNYLLSAVLTPLYGWSSPEFTSSAIIEVSSTNGDIVWQRNFTFAATNQATIGEVLYNATNQQIAYVFNDATTLTQLTDGTIGIGTATNTGSSLNHTYLGYGNLYALDNVADDGYIITGYQLVGSQRDIYLGRVNTELLTPGCENSPLEIANSNRLFIKTYSTWTINNIDSYIQPNQSITTTAVDLTETGELCSTNCEEICDNNLDDNNNGLIDENCPCPILTLNADTSICVSQSVQLDASFGFDTYQWTPTTNLSNPNIRNPLATPTQSTNYTVTATKLSQNKIVNGDFSMGNVGFASGQTYSNTYSPCNYYVDDLWFGSLFPESDDHTPTTDGMFMHIDGCPAATVVWQQTIADIIPNTNYKFAFWATRSDVNPPIFELHFIGNATNDNLLATQSATEPFVVNWQWDEYGIPIWNSGNNTELTIRIINLETNGMGNDFGLDDFSLQQICTDTAHIQLNVLSDSLIYQQNVTCSTAGKVIVNGVNGLPPYQYQINGGAWQYSGTFSPLDAGSYTIITKDANDCTVTRTLTIGTSNTPINLTLDQIQHATCNTLGAVWIGITDSTSIYYQYVLDSTLAQTNGVFTNLTAGEHSVTVNNDLGCTATLTFTINNNGAITDTLTQTSCNPADVGTVTNTFVAMNGCDSTITVITTLLLSITDTLTQTSCNPADVGTVTNTFVAMNGCDSTVTVITTLIAPIDCNDNDCNTTDTYNDQTCQCDHTDILPPNCNDNNPNTLDTYNQATCECLHTELITLLLPNAFSPNNDGVNDFWGITGLGINTIYLRVYNRWGEKVFETHNLADTWDGKYKGFNCEIGVYAYYLTGTFNNNETFVRKGNVSLIR